MILCTFVKSDDIKMAVYIQWPSDPLLHESFLMEKVMATSIGYDTTEYCIKSYLRGNLLSKT